MTASIKRHSMHRESWRQTQLWEQWSDTIKSFIAEKVSLAPTELGIIGYLENDEYGYLITTQRILIYENSLVRSIKIDDIETYDLGMNFKGYLGQQTEAIKLRCKDGRTDQFRFETGYPSMGAIYGLRTVLSVGRTKLSTPN